MINARPGLQLPVTAMSLVIPMTVFHDLPGGAGVATPSGLISFSAMSGGELQDIADMLAAEFGMEEGKHYAMIDGMSGPFITHQLVRLEAPDQEYQPWFAYLDEETRYD